MTDKPDIEAIERREQAATNGPWEASTDALGDGVFQEHIKEGFCITRGPNNSAADAQRMKADAEFISRARDDIPDLLAYTQSLEAEVERLRTALALAPEEDDLNAGREYMRHAWHEFNAIRARDGAPEGVSHEWWSEVTEALGRLLGDDTKPWMLGAAKELLAPSQAEIARLRTALGGYDNLSLVIESVVRTAEPWHHDKTLEAIREGRAALEGKDR